MIGALLSFVIATFLQPHSHAGVVRGASVTIEQRLPAVAAILKPIPPNPATAPAVSAKSALVLDQKTKAVLYAKGADDQRVVASVTKLMTSLLIIAQNPDLAKTITITSDDNDPEGSRLPVKTGAVLTINDLLYATLVESANNAAEALARSSGMPETMFVARMNQRAQELGMTHTRFTDVTGLGAKNVSTARDLAILMNAAFAQPIIRAATTTPRYSITDQSTQKKFIVQNTDILAGSRIRIVAGKTGFIPASGGNFVSRIRGIGERELDFVVLESNSTTTRFTDTKALADWAFANTVWK